jgi:6-phosphogluconolactonase
VTAGTPEFKSFDHAGELAEELAVRIRERLQAGIGVRGSASLVVSGGSTPVPLFVSLSNAELDWEKTFITLADERWVAPAESDSNERLVREHLLKNRASVACFVGLKTGAETAEDGEKECAQGLARLPTPFDVLILGMGNDGHTASLFPGASGLPVALDIQSGKICMAITPPAAPHARMTLTLPTLLNSREIIFLITGSEKRTVHEQAAAGGPIEEMPIRAFLYQDTTPVTIWWAP